jgi:hypothetical protein
MTLDDELKRLGLLGDAEKAFNAKLDTIGADTVPRFTRQISHERRDGYMWNPVIGIYEEGDTLFRKRIREDAV